MVQRAAGLLELLADRGAHRVDTARGVLPRTGHAMNLEEPDAFNALVDDFLATVEAGRWDTGESPGDTIL